MGDPAHQPGVYQIRRSKKMKVALPERPKPRLHLPPPGSKVTNLGSGYLWSPKNQVLSEEQTTDLFEQVHLFRRHAWDALLRYPRVASKLLARFPSESVTPLEVQAATRTHGEAKRGHLVEFFLQQDPHGKELARAVEDFLAFGRKEDRFDGLRCPNTGNPLYVKASKDVSEVWSSLNCVRMRLVEANLRLAVAHAKHYCNNNLEVPDLINEATFGLLKAIDRFDLSRGLKFSTYGVHWVRHELGRALVNAGRTIRIPAHLQSKAYTIRKLWELCDGDLDRIAKKIGGTRKQVERAVDAYRIPLSLDFRPSEGCSIQGALSDGSVAADELLFLEELGPFLQTHLDHLPPRLRNIIEKRFGLNGYQKMTLEEIGNEHSLSRERIRQLESSALDCLRDSVARESSYLGLNA